MQQNDVCSRVAPLHLHLQAAYGCDDFRTTNLALASEEVTTRWLDHLWEEDALLAWCLEAQQVSESMTSLEVVRRDTFRALFQKLAQDGRELRMRQLNVDGESCTHLKTHASGLRMQFPALISRLSRLCNKMPPNIAAVNEIGGPNAEI